MLKHQTKYFIRKTYKNTILSNYVAFNSSKQLSKWFSSTSNVLRAFQSIKSLSRLALWVSDPKLLIGSALIPNLHHIYLENITGEETASPVSASHLSHNCNNRPGMARRPSGECLVEAAMATVPWRATDTHPKWYKQFFSDVKAIVNCGLKLTGFLSSDCWELCPIGSICHLLGDLWPSAWEEQIFSLALRLFYIFLLRLQRLAKNTPEPKNKQSQFSLALLLLTELILTLDECWTAERQTDKAARIALWQISRYLLY